MSFNIGLPDTSTWGLPKKGIPRPPLPFSSPVLTFLFEKSLHVSTPLTIAIVYFSVVHFSNPIVANRQIRQAGIKEKNAGNISPAELKKLKPAPYKIAKTGAFKIFVLLHNIFLSIYSAWTFLGMLSTFSRSISQIKLITNTEAPLQNFVYAVCDLENGIFQLNSEDENLTLFGWWFYISKFYEVIDTIVILLKGRPSSLLQSYHHAGAMMCMWSGIRYQSPPIWIFVVFNSFIHALMYLYFTLCCVKIRLPIVVKRVLTSLQITQFVVGGSLALIHVFIWFNDLSGLGRRACINTAEQAFPILINVAYLAPLTMLFAAFYVESYLKRKIA